LGWFIFKFRRHNFINVKSWLDVATFGGIDEPNINFHLKLISEKSSAIMAQKKEKQGLNTSMITRCKQNNDDYKVANSHIASCKC
jgi:hypothetical protein